MATKLDTRQSVNRSALSMVGSAANDSLDTILPKIDAELAKLFEDRNVMLQNGGIITFTGTQIQFTENLELAINQKISGAAPQVISLGMANVNLNNNEMWYATVDRGAGTAVMAIASTLPAVTSANQEIYLIAKRVDAGDGTQRVYWRNGMALNAGQSVRLGASGSGSGSGTGDDLIALQFRASFQDNFDEGPADSKSAVDITAGKTDATAYNAAKAMYTLNYDASKTIAAATTTTNINISAVAAFTVKIGDVVIANGQARRITAVATQASFTTDAFDVAPTLGAQVTVSQAVHTKDIYNLDVDGNSIADAFPGESFSEILLDYEDTSSAGDNIFDINVAPVVAFDASHDGTAFTDTKVRPTLETDTIDSIFLEAAGTALYVRLYANKTSGSGIVNVLRYKTSLQKQDSAQAGGIMNSAYAFTNGVGTPVNCTVALMGGKTALTLNWNFAVGVLPGTSASSVEVWINGQKIPRYIDATLTPDASFTEEGPNVIKLDRDYSGYNLSVEVFYRTAIVDDSIENSNDIVSSQDVYQAAFQAFVDDNSFLTPTTAGGSPASGTFHSTVNNRASLVNLLQDLKVRMGPERIQAQQIYNIQGEFGPTGQRVWGLPNDIFGQVRFVGSRWQLDTAVDTNGPKVQSNQIGDFVEITFYGTGLNLLTHLNATNNTLQYAVDGGSPATFLTGAYAAILSGRNYLENAVVPVVNNLSLGIHTVKISLSAGTFFICSGFEILTETTSLRVAPGISYARNKKLTLGSLQSPAYNSSFEYGTLGTRGGRVIVYQKADGTIGKSVQPVDAAQANMSSADHTNEEVQRSYYWREFGSGRSDDFSTLVTTNSTRAFTLDDGTTSLIVQGASTAPNAEVYPETTNNYAIIHFVGTGLDIIEGFTAAVSATWTVSVDGTDIVTTTNIFSGIYGNRVKIVSGLPYGSHVVKFLRTSAATTGTFKDFIVYQPKKPSIPTGSTEIADYCINADFVANATAGHNRISQGTIRKAGWREMVFNGGSWVIASTSAGIANNQIIPEQTTNASGNYWEYTFWGTGFDFRFGSGSNRSATNTVTLNGTTLTAANFPTAAFSVYGTGVAFNSGTGVLDQQDAASVEGSGFVTSGLPLAKYTIRITNNTANFFIVNCIDIITPVYHSKWDAPSDIQATLSIGSTAIGDTRKFSAIDNPTEKKVRVAAYGITATPSTSSTIYVPIPEISVNVYSKGGWFEARVDIDIRNSAGTGTFLAVAVNGLVVAERGNSGPATNVDCFYSWPALIYLSPGFHKIEGFWRASSGTLTNFSNRVITVKEL